MKKLFFILALGVAILLPFTATHAQLKAGIDKLDAANRSTGLSTADLGQTVGSIIAIVLSLIGTIFLVLLIYAGILWMTARGDSEQVSKSKDIIRAAIIGLVIVLSAYAITYFVGTRLSGAGSAATNPSVSGNANCGQYTTPNECSSQSNGLCVFDSNVGVCLPNGM